MEIKPKQTFYTSWGYDQTNYDFIVVEKVSPTGKTCICRRAKLAENIPEEQTWKQRPKPEGYGKSFRMKIKSYDDSLSLRGSYIFCGGEDSDHKRYGWFSLVKEGDYFHETDSRFGH